MDIKVATPTISTDKIPTRYDCCYAFDTQRISLAIMALVYCVTEWVDR